MSRQSSYVLLLFVVGCSPATGDVSGRVTYQGRSVPTGTISFHSSGKVFSAAIDDGAFEARGLPLGAALVTIVRLDPNQPNPLDGIRDSRQQMTHPSGDKSPDFVAEGVKLRALQRKRHLLPLEYSATETSGLQLTVASGKNPFNVELRDK